MAVKETIDYIVSWLKDYAKTSKAKGFVVGVSGGIDSALTSTLCAKTGLPTLCVEMPIHQAKNQIERGQEHIEQLKKKFKNTVSVTVNLTLTFEEFKKSVPSDNNVEKVDLSLANTRARFRMTSLYYLAGIKNFLVVGTGNKVEDFGVGFYTKYGDGGVDISPIADLVKSEVYELAEFLKVPISIRKANPTDGLFGDNRSDENQLKATYDELEWAMKMDALGISEIEFNNRELEVFKIYKRLNKNNRHKMLPIPVCKIPQNLK